MLLPEESHAIDHLLSPGACSLEPLVETRVLALEELSPLRRRDPFDAGLLEGLEAGFCLQRTPTERSELIAEVFHQQLQLRKRGYFRTYAV
jgi:hypothetical protein